MASYVQAEKAFPAEVASAVRTYYPVRGAFHLQGNTRSQVI